MFLINVLKEGFRKERQIDRNDLIAEVCKHSSVVEKLQVYNYMIDWLIMEARHLVTKEAPKVFPSTSAFVDISHVKTTRHLQFGRDVQEVLVHG